MSGSDEAFPVTRSNCVAGVRPCPWVRCKHNMLLSVTKAKTIRLIPLTKKHRHPHSLKVDAPQSQVEYFTTVAANRLMLIDESCCLDISDRPARLSIKAMARMMGVTESSIRVQLIRAVDSMRKEREKRERKEREKGEKKRVEKSRKSLKLLGQNVTATLPSL